MQRTVPLTKFVTVGEAECREVVLREATAGDVIEATEEAERVAMTPQGPALLVSPTRLGLGVLRRQVVSFGSLSGPADLAWIKRLSPADLDSIQAEAEAMDAAVSLDVGAALSDRGRTDGSGGND
ncbi:phage tail assembly protein [Pseudodesulfovibrio indicus]|uniref:Phage FluMu protein gp41 n=1 Tax=Pseudodesulfovibrio indicus TaxID=1716143 RepID=A0A140D8Y5_9BACT|nr:phage tail assembly protein [Pseudodesulfovibrio indicus]AMK09652.1 hypothetical protein AWY79_00280 [Pseudodesulfovibrio indicus]TDT86396.1 phage FluMu protein gp41 [Pseudodesulfovibrio indicus]